MKVTISFSKEDIEGAKEYKAKGEYICDAISCEGMDFCEMCPLQMLNDDEAIQYMESHQADDDEEEEEENEEPSANPPTSGSTTPSIGALMVKKMIEAYERRSEK